MQCVRLPKAFGDAESQVDCACAESVGVHAAPTSVLDQSGVQPVEARAWTRCGSFYLKS